jgi:hypothetical protein
MGGVAFDAEHADGQAMTSPEILSLALGGQAR